MVDKLPNNQGDLFESPMIPQEEPTEQSDSYKLSVKLGFTPLVVGSLDVKGQVDLDAVGKVLDLEPKQKADVTLTENNSFIATPKKRRSLAIGNNCPHCGKRIFGTAYALENKKYCSSNCMKQASADHKIIEDFNS